MLGMTRHCMWLRKTSEQTMYVKFSKAFVAVLMVTQSQPPMANWYNGVLKWVSLCSQICTV